jgi:hypothetical protein
VTVLYSPALIGAELNARPAARGRVQLELPFGTPPAPAPLLSMNFGARAVVRLLTATFGAATPLLMLSMNFAAAAAPASVVNLGFGTVTTPTRLLTMTFGAPRPSPIRTLSMQFALPNGPAQLLNLGFAAGSYWASPYPPPGSYAITPAYPGVYSTAHGVYLGSYSLGAPNLPGAYAAGAAAPGIYRVASPAAPGLFSTGTQGPSGAYTVGDLTKVLAIELRLNFAKIPNPDPPGGVSATQRLRLGFAEGFYVANDYPRAPLLSLNLAAGVYTLTRPSATQGTPLPPQPACYIITVIPNTLDDCRLGMAVIGEAVIP